MQLLPKPSRPRPHLRCPPIRVPPSTHTHRLLLPAGLRSTLARRLLHFRLHFLGTRSPFRRSRRRPVPRPKSPQRLARRAARMPRLPRRLPIGRPRPARRAKHQQWRRRQRRRSPPRFRRRSCRISWCVQLGARASGPPMKDSLWNSVRFVPGAVFSVREQSELVFYRRSARRDRLPMWSSRALLRRHRRRRCLQRVSIPAHEWNARPAPLHARISPWQLRMLYDKVRTVCCCTHAHRFRFMRPHAHRFCFMRPHAHRFRFMQLRIRRVLTSRRRRSLQANAR